MALPELPPALCTLERHGAEIVMLNSPDKIGRMFSQGQLYESPMLEWVWGQGLEGVAIDAGANIGLMSLWFSLVCGFEVHAFEPVMPHVLGANVDLNPRARVNVWPWGLGAEQADYHHVSKGVLKPGVSRESTDEKLTVVRLDDVVRHEAIDGVALIKVDVEGMEVDVLKGGMWTIERDRPVILTEEWKTATTQEIGRLLKPLGYRRTNAFGGRGKAPVGAWQVAQ